MKRPPFRRPPPASPSHPLAQALRRIDALLSSDKTGFRELVEEAGLAPDRDFRGVELNGVPLTGEDIRGFDFTGADLRDTGVQSARFDRTTRFDGALFNGKSLDPEVIDFNHSLRDLRFAEAEKAVRRRLDARRVVDVVGFSTMIAKAPDIERAEGWFAEMRRKEVDPNEFTYSALIKKSPDEPRAAHWFAQMQAQGVAPNVVTFTSLIEKAPDEPRAAHWFAQMQARGVVPDDVTFNTLIAKSPDADAARRWLARMREAGVEPNDVTRETLTRKGVDLDAPPPLTA
jgi:hypothetical protein